MERRISRHPLSDQFSGKGLILNGTAIEGNLIALDGKFALDAETLSRLFMLPNHSVAGVRKQEKLGADASPPGLYIKSDHAYLANGHMNSVGLYKNANRKSGVFVDGVFIDHIFFDAKKAPRGLATVGFFLLAATAYRLDFSEITLLAAGGAIRHEGKWNIPNMVGYKVWPKFGFDAPLEAGETDAHPHLAKCQTVQDIRKQDLEWWEDLEGNGRVMRFDLRPHSESWRTLLDYLRGNWGVQ